MATSTRLPADAQCMVNRIDALPNFECDEPVAATLLTRFLEGEGVPDVAMGSNHAALRTIAETLDGLPSALEAAAGLLAFTEPESLASTIQAHPEVIYRHAPAGRSSLLQRVESILGSLAAGERDQVRGAGWLVPGGAAVPDAAVDHG